MKNIYVVIIFMPSLAAIGSISSEIIFDEIEPIIWVETDNLVDYGSKRVIMSFAFVSPCDLGVRGSSPLCVDNTSYSILQERYKDNYFKLVTLEFVVSRLKFGATSR